MITMKIKKQMILWLGLMAGTMVVDAGERVIEVRLSVPDSAWEITIDSICQVKEEIWVVSTVSRAPGLMGAQVISKKKTSVTINAGDLPVKCFVIGKTWGWENKEGYTFIKDLKQIEQELRAGTLLYKKAK